LELKPEPEGGTVLYNRGFFHLFQKQKQRIFFQFTSQVRKNVASGYLVLAAAPCHHRGKQPTVTGSGIPLRSPFPRLQNIACHFKLGPRALQCQMHSQSHAPTFRAQTPTPSTLAFKLAYPHQAASPSPLLHSSKQCQQHCTKQLDGLPVSGTIVPAPVVPRRPKFQLP
jgi:hypothetical protein